MASAPLAPPRRPSGLVRILATLALLALVGTFVAAQIDFVKRHRPGKSPESYWRPQITQIWAPGLTVGIICATAAWWFHRRQPRT